MRSRFVSIAALFIASATALGQVRSLSATPQGSAAAPPPDKLLPKSSDSPDYGLASTTYVQIPASAFYPWDSSREYSSDGGHGSRRWPTNLAAYFNAPLSLPSGAQIVYFEIDYLDQNPGDAITGQIADCDYRGLPCTSYPTVPSGAPSCPSAGLCSGIAETSGPSGSHQSVDLTSYSLFVDNFLRHYQIFMTVPKFDGSLKIGGVIVGYRLRVSPAPGTATFPNDVPTSHPYFRFIEALAAAGITGGCGPGSYCPNSPITRGEMAVFLAAALGLHWP
jgi:hypothetical protein